MSQDHIPTAPVGAREATKSEHTSPGLARRAGPGPANGWGRGAESEAEAGLSKADDRERLQASA